MIKKMITIALAGFMTLGVCSTGNITASASGLKDTVISQDGDSDEITREQYEENPDDYIEMEKIDLINNETSIYYMDNYPEDTPFPSTEGSKGLLGETISGSSVIGNPIDTDSIIGTDDRNVVTETTRIPYRYIGQLIVTYERPNKSRYNLLGTAFLVGKSSLLTSAHCVYKENDTIVSAKFYPGQNGTSNRPYTYTCSEFHVPTKYKTAINSGDTTNQNKYDYALIKLSSNAGTTLGYFALGGYNTQYNCNNLIGEQVTVVGYPGEKAGKMYRHKGTINSFNTEKWKIYYKMDTTAGQSGSPVILPKSGGKYYVVGIHYLGGTTENSARYITKNIYDLVNKYK